MSWSNYFKEWWIKRVYLWWLGINLFIILIEWRKSCIFYRKYYKWLWFKCNFIDNKDNFCFYYFRRWGNAFLKGCRGFYCPSNWKNVIKSIFYFIYVKGIKNCWKSIECGSDGREWCFSIRWIRKKRTYERTSGKIRGRKIWDRYFRKIINKNWSFISCRFWRSWILDYSREYE